MKNPILITIMVMLLSLTGCAVTDFDRSVDFQGLRTYSWTKPEVNVSNPLYKGDLIDKKIRKALADEFSKRGIVQVDKDPDFLVTYKTHTEKKEQVRNSYSGFHPYMPFGYVPYFYRTWAWGIPYGYGFPSEVRQYTEGTLVIDLKDAKSGETFWRGSVTGNVNNIKNITKQIDKGVRAILKKYPANAIDDEKLLPEKEEVS